MPYIGNPIYQSAFVTDQFSGDGTTTAYTMSVAPAGTSNVLVVVSGVVQDPSTYSTIGNTLTFSTAPPTGTGNISCRYLGVPATGVTTTAYRTVTEFTATASQTTFTPPSYTVGYINVYQNGVLLGSADYTATNGTTVVLATGASLDDLVTVESFLVESVLNAIPNSPSSVGSTNIVDGAITTAKLATQTSIPMTYGSLGSGNASIMKNRIINGAMVVNQRGGTVTSSSGGTYGVDRFTNFASGGGVFTAVQSSTVPTGAGFVNSNLLTVTTADSSIASSDYYAYYQAIEGYNTADLQWGTASAKTVTLSFWVNSSVTGLFAVALLNNDGTRGYPATYTISSANTWQQVSVTITGCTDGTWNTTNSVGIGVRWDLGSGSGNNGTANTWNTGSYVGLRTSSTVNWIATSGATFYITGVQLEVGSFATGFQYVNYQTSLANCQRYFETSYPAGATIPTALANGWTSTTLQNIAEGPSGVVFKVTKRANPTMVMYNAVNGTAGSMYRASDANSITASFDFIGVNQVSLVRPSSSSANSYYLHWTASIEL